MFIYFISNRLKYVYKRALIQEAKEVTLVKPAGKPREHPEPDPNEVMPICGQEYYLF